MKTIIAVDPGVSGGLAALYAESATPFVSFGFKDMTHADIIAEFKSIRAGTSGELIAVMEDIQRFSPMPAARMAEYALSFEEMVMGWPIGWTALTPLGMDKFRQWLQLHGGF